jgi:predicted aspartyl protease
MDDVGNFRTTIGIENLAAPGRIAHLPESLVDTGSEFTWAPRPVVESLGITPQRRQQFMVADGRLIEREIGFAIIHAGGVTAPDFVVFGEATDTTLLGVRSLEGLNLRVDVVSKRLIDAGPIITAAVCKTYPAPTIRLAR